MSMERDGSTGEPNDCEACWGRWVVLERTTLDDGTLLDVMAAHSCDGIGTIARWSLCDGRWEMREATTEDAEMVPPDDDTGRWQPPPTTRPVSHLLAEVEARASRAEVDAGRWEGMRERIAEELDALQSMARELDEDGDVTMDVCPHGPIASYRMDGGESGVLHAVAERLRCRLGLERDT